MTLFRLLYIHRQRDGLNLPLKQSVLSIFEVYDEHLVEFFINKLQKEDIPIKFVLGGLFECFNSWIFQVLPDKGESEMRYDGMVRMTSWHAV